jgi:hypothetical protein
LIYDTLSFEIRITPKKSKATKKITKERKGETRVKAEYNN